MTTLHGTTQRLRAGGGLSIASEAVTDLGGTMLDNTRVDGHGRGDDGAARAPSRNRHARSALKISGVGVENEANRLHSGPPQSAPFRPTSRIG
jgi:hypothetical protein